MIAINISVACSRFCLTLRFIHLSWQKKKKTPPTRHCFLFCFTGVARPHLYWLGLRKQKVTVQVLLQTKKKKKGTQTEVSIDLLTSAVKSCVVKFRESLEWVGNWRCITFSLKCYFTDVDSIYTLWHCDWLSSIVWRCFTVQIASKCDSARGFPACVIHTWHFVFFCFFVKCGKCSAWVT